MELNLGRVFMLSLLMLLLVEAKGGAHGQVVDHSLWDEVLAAVVVPGQEKSGIKYSGVDFDKLRNDQDLRKKHLDYLDVLASTELSGLSKREQIALVINAYNAFVVDLIVVQNPKNSIRDLTSWWRGSVFDRFKYKLLVDGEVKDLSLNDVEHGLLRERITGHDIPEVHSGVNCVSVSCPNLRGEAFTGPKLKKQMGQQTKLWLQNEGKGLRMDKENNVLYMSAIFDWFREDFVSSKYGGKNDKIDTREPVEWAVQFATDEVKQFVKDSKPSIRFMTYDWDLIRVAKEQF